MMLIIPAAGEWVIPAAVTVLLVILAGLIAGYQLRRRKPNRYDGCTVTLLPKRVSCCRGALTFSVPTEYRIEKRQNGNAILVGSDNLRLTVMQLPIRDDIRIRTLTGTELRRYFSEAVPMRSTPEVSYSYHGHSPALTAWWRTEPADTLACMHLIQVPEALFLMQFTGLSIYQQSSVEPILYSITVRRDRIRTAGEQRYLR